MARELTPHRVRNVLAVLLFLVAVLGLGVAAYATHLRPTATALVNSAPEIRTTADAEREIAAWSKRPGKGFWIEPNYPGGDHNYDARIVNLPITRLHVVEPTGVA